MKIANVSTLQDFHQHKQKIEKNKSFLSDIMLNKNFHYVIYFQYITCPRNKTLRINFEK